MLFHQKGEVCILRLLCRILRSCVRLPSRSHWYSHLRRYRKDSYKTSLPYPQTFPCGTRSCSHRAHRSGGRRSRQEVQLSRRDPPDLILSRCPAFHRFSPSICFRSCLLRRYTGHTHNPYPAYHPVTVAAGLQIIHRAVKMKLNLLFQFCVHIFQHDIIDVRTQRRTDASSSFSLFCIHSFLNFVPAVEYIFVPSPP